MQKFSIHSVGVSKKIVTRITIAKYSILLFAMLKNKSYIFHHVTLDAAHYLLVTLAFHM